jgi:uncharacterized repeat protein (TIGR02543 family)
MYVIGQGTVAPGNGTYLDHSTVEIKAFSAAGWVFQGWMGDATGTTNTSITMYADRVVAAIFVPANNAPTTNPVAVATQVGATTISWTYSDENGDLQTMYEVEVWTGPSGSGTNVWNPTPGTGTATSIIYTGFALVPGQTYYARVRAHDGKDWGTWSEKSFSITARYTLTMYVIGQGTVTPGNGTYAAGASVNIDAINAAGWIFQGWTGNTSGTTNTSITMYGNTVVTATFVPEQPANNPPTTNPVTVTAQNGVTTISWTYSDEDGDSQTMYEVEVWTSPGGLGTNMWNPTPGTGTAPSVVYAGSLLVPGQTYYVRVKAFDGKDWGQWSEKTIVGASINPMNSLPPTASPVTVTTLNGVTTISWNYRDADGDPQVMYEVEVWTHSGGMGTAMWDPAIGIGTARSVVYSGSPFTSGQNYVARVRAFDGVYWSAWAETNFKAITPQQSQ